MIPMYIDAPICIITTIAIKWLWELILSHDRARLFSISYTCYGFADENKNCHIFTKGRGKPQQPRHTLSRITRVCIII